ncbi:MAG: hypothetical protein ACI90V_000525, partial [Bacillariaceae sp.]
MSPNSATIIFSPAPTPIPNLLKKFNLNSEIRNNQKHLCTRGTTMEQRIGGFRENMERGVG